MREPEHRECRILNSLALGAPERKKPAAPLRRRRDSWGVKRPFRRVDGGMDPAEFQIAGLQLFGGGKKKQRREPSGRLQRQNWPSGDGCASRSGTNSAVPEIR